MFISPFFALIMLMSILLGFLAFLVRMLFKRKAASKKVSEACEVKEQCLPDSKEGKEV